MATRRKKRRAKRAKRSVRRKVPRYVGFRKTPLKKIPPERQLAIQKMLVESYAEQLDDIGRILAAHGIISLADVKRDGVRFAILKKFEPDKAAYEDKRPRR